MLEAAVDVAICDFSETFLFFWVISPRSGFAWS